MFLFYAQQNAVWVKLCPKCKTRNEISNDVLKFFKCDNIIKDVIYIFCTIEFNKFQTFVFYLLQ